MYVGDKGVQEDFFKFFMVWYDIVEQNKVNKIKNFLLEKLFVKFVRMLVKCIYVD